MSPGDLVTLIRRREDGNFESEARIWCEGLGRHVAVPFGTAGLVLSVHDGDKYIPVAEVLFGLLDGGAVVSAFVDRLGAAPEEAL